MAELKILTLNIGNPSLERAQKQVNWLEQRDEDIFVLTETKNSEGCHFIEEYFTNYGYNLLSLGSTIQYYVYFPQSTTNDLGVMIISKFPFIKTYSIFNKDDKFYSRFAACEIKYESQILNIIGLYVPSRDASIEKINRKKEYCIAVANYLKCLKHNNHIICGDFNILSKNHIPHYSNFLNWEYRFYDLFIELAYLDAFTYCNNNVNDYSWVGRTNDGYRYDYFFVSRSLSIKNCYFVHETRETNRITDHSAVYLSLNI